MGSSAGWSLNRRSADQDPKLVRASPSGFVSVAVAAIAFVIAHRYRSYKSATGERGPIGAHAPGAARHAEAQKVPVPAADRMPMASADEPAAVKRQLPPPAVRIIRREPAAGE